MLSRKTLFKYVDRMIDNFYNDIEPVDIRLSNFKVWLSCSYAANIIDFEDYDYVKAYGYEKIKNMNDYN